MAQGVRRKIPRRIPADAETREIGGPLSGTEFWVAGRLFARVYWHDTGHVEHEVYFDEEGRTHGLERHGFEDGRTMYRARWVHGVQHGWQQQWDKKGRLLVRTRFVHGTGLDVWFACQKLAETREYLNGDRHGFERWWCGPGRLYSEGHYWCGVEHGVFREWNAGSRLRRGFPRYYVHGRQVTRREYLRSQASDPTLPPVRAKDNLPRRPRALIPLASAGNGKSWPSTPAGGPN